MMSRGDVSELATLLSSKRAVVLKRWERRLKAQARALREGEFQRELEPLVDELIEALRTRGEAAGPVFGAIAAEWAARRFRAGVPLKNVTGAMWALHGAVLDAVVRPLPIQASQLLAACVGDAITRAALEYVRQSAASATGGDPATREALDAVGPGVAIFDQDGQPRLSSRGIERIFGAPAHELRDPMLAHAALEVLRSGKPLADEVHTITNLRSDEQHQVGLSAQPLADGSGAVVVARDITDEQRRVRDLERADHELQSLHARLLRLGHDRSMGDLAAGTALALNNELNALALSLRLLRTELPPEAGEPQRHIQAMDAAVRRSATLVARLQELASRRAPTTPRQLDLNAAVMEALDLVRPELTAAATDRSVRVDAHLGSVRPVLAPAPELRELLCKLLLAARDELHGGGVVTLRTVDDPDVTTLLVAHPAGGEDEHQELLLEGVRDLARRWGGELSTDFVAGNRELRLRLPPAVEEQPPAPPPPERRTQRAERVLVVDDDAGNRETLSELLALSGHEVDDAATSEEALLAVERRSYSAALVDLAMPGMNGLELARRLRAKHPELRIALVTGWEPPDIGGAEAVDAVFRKPIDLAAIDSFLAGGAAARHS